MVRPERFCESWRRAVRQRTANNRRRALPVPEKRRPRVLEGGAIRQEPDGRDSLRDSESDEHAQVREFREQRGGGHVVVWPCRHTGRIHADLAAELQVPVLALPLRQAERQKGGKAERKGTKAEG